MPSVARDPRVSDSGKRAIDDELEARLKNAEWIILLVLANALRKRTPNELHEGCGYSQLAGVLKARRPAFFSPIYQASRCLI